MNVRLQPRGRELVGRSVSDGGCVRPPSSRGGFTLVELVITLAVLAILLNFAAPSFRDTIARLEQSARHNRLASDLHLARTEAIKRAARIRVCPRGGEGECGGGWADGWHVYVERGGDATGIDADETILRTYAPTRTDGFSIAANAIVLPAASGVASGIAFDSRGRADWTLGTFVLCDGRGAAGALALIVNGAGGFRGASESDTSDGVVTDALGNAVTCPT